MIRSNKSNLFLGLCIILMFSCSKGGNNKTMDEAYEISNAFPMPEENIDSRISDESGKSKESASSAMRFTSPIIVPDFISTAAATGINDDETHKFIRTAQMKFKVKDVIEATHLIENIILTNRGFILNSSIVNKKLSPQTINISKDSSLVIDYLNLESKLRLKVPCQLLDTTLRQIAPLAVSIDYRTVEATDVTAKLMSEKMAQARMAKKQKRLSSAIDNKGQKLSDITDAEEAFDNSLEREDNARIDEFIINEQIAYSTISIDLYQDVIEYRSVISRVEIINDYESGIGFRIVDGLINGWSIISAIFIFFVNIWPITLIILVSFVIYIRISRKRTE